MRDDFSGATIEQLAKRVGYRCSNPGCRRPTSGPRDDPEKSVNIGVAAHITASSPGGARYDETLTSAQRRSISNGIWLSQDCAKLVDNDAEKYAVDLLREWKEGAEERARLEIEQPAPDLRHEPTLTMPSATTSASWLSYVSQSTTFSGRTEEMDLLKAFLERQEQFSWWIITGPAGSGKSRLALELCQAIEGGWHAGFLSRAESFNEWAHWQPIQDTLVVIDYVAGRAIEASDIALQLARRKSTLSRRVRILLVEREPSGSWWPDYMREASYSESVVMASSQYALPIQLASIDDRTIITLVSEISALFGVELTEYDRERTLALTKSIDPAGRPLFAMIAAAAQLEGIPQHTREQIVRSILVRETARWRTLIPDAEPRERALNLLALTTMLGGFSPTSDIGTGVWNSSAGSLLPSRYFLDDQLFGELAGGSMGESGLQSLQPDFVGEAFVLERLKGTSGTKLSTQTLLKAGWDHDLESVSQFVRRAVTDFPGDPAASILQEPVSDTEVQREVWSRLVADLVTIQFDSDDAQGPRNLTALRNLALKHPGEARLQRNRATAEFNFGNLLFQEGEYERADDQFSLAISLSAEGSDTQANSLNNRGIVRLSLRSREEGLADFSAVIGMQAASDEVRACAFNNRADIFRADGNVENAIKDRSNVLELEETSYNRRFIAHFRRSIEYLKLRQTHEALDDLAAILNTEDIVPEQKMQAHLQRARIFQHQERSKEALSDLGSVISSAVNFRGAVPEALVLRGQIHLAADNDDEALRDFSTALAQGDADGSTIAEAYFGCGIALMSMDEVEEARVALIAAREHPDASDDVQHQSEEILSSFEAS